MRHVYRKAFRSTHVLAILNVHRANQYERWLQKQQASFSKGTMLLTGLGGCVHYGAHYDGFRLTPFQNDLHPAWKMVKEYGVLTYLPVPEPVRLWGWELSEQIGDIAPVSADTSASGENPDDLHMAGMMRFDQGDCPGAQPHFRRVIEGFPKSLFQDPGPRSLRQMGGESRRRSEGRRRHSWRAMSRRRERAPRSQPQNGAEADGRGFGIGSSHFPPSAWPA